MAGKDGKGGGGAAWGEAHKSEGSRAGSAPTACTTTNPATSVAHNCWDGFYKANLCSIPRTAECASEILKGY